MGTRKSDDVVVGVSDELVFIVIGFGVLKLTDTALVVTWFLLPQQELE